MITTEECRESNTNELSTSVSELLGVDEHDIDLYEDMSIYGFDLMKFTEFANKINKKYSLEITHNIFYEYSTIDPLPHYLYDTYKESFMSYYNAEDVPASSENKMPKIAIKVMLSWGARIVDTDMHPIDRTYPAIRREVVIEDNVWIGSKATILKGVRVGKGAVVTADSVVVSNVPPYTLVMGNPAKVIRKIGERG
ncbi:MAG: phosphopantetheine-binding protein [bacterium]